MYSSIVPVIGWVLTLAILGLAWWKGAAPEKFGAVAILVTAVEVWVIETFAPQSSETILLLVSDGLLAVAFLVLAVRYASLFLGAAMIFQAAQFALHAVYATGEMDYDRRYAIINNIVTIGIHLVILSATVATWLRRKRRTRALAAAAAETAHGTPVAP